MAGMVEDGEPVRAGSEHHSGYDDILKSVAVRSELFMEVLEILTALLMVVLFAVGVFDLGLRLFELGVNGTYTDPNEVVKLIDTALLLLIIVEIYRTIVAYIEDLKILPLVINVAIIAMARKVIIFRTGKFPTYSDALTAAAAYGLLLTILIGAFYFVHKGQEITDFDIYSEPFSTSAERKETADVPEP